MNARCVGPLTDEELLDYWTHSTVEADTDRLEEHLFSCGECSARLESMVSLGAGLTALVRRGRISGVVSRSLLNRLQRDGVQVRVFTLSPGERVPCAAYPGDELMVVSLRADFSRSETVTLSISGPEQAPVGRLSDVPVSAKDVEILWATPGDTVRRIPSTRLHLTITSQAPDATILGEYELDHTSIDPQ